MARLLARRIASALLSAAVAGHVAGCGGGGGRSSAAATGPTTTASPVTSATPGPTTTATPTPSFQAVAFETIDRGSDSPRGVTLGAHEVVAATAADWAAVWASHAPGALPALDPSRECVVATFLGPISGGSHGTEVVRVWRDVRGGRDLRALVREFRLAPWKINTANLTSPFHLVRCAASVIPGGALSVARQDALDFDVLEAGSDSAIGANDPAYTGELALLRDAGALATFYARHRPGAAPPLVDFSQAMVLAVLGGHVASFGNSVETLRVLHDRTADEVRVIHRVNGYRGGAAPPPATETPFQLLRVMRATGPVRAEVQRSAAATPLAAGTTALYAGPAEQLVVRDAATFTSLWTARVGGPVPVVDFAASQVLLAFEAAGSGRSVDVAGATAWEDDELFVRVHAQSTWSPWPDAAYSAVTTPRTSGPTRFEVRDVTPVP
jgi:hypothetical protein